MIPPANLVEVHNDLMRRQREVLREYEKGFEEFRNEQLRIRKNLDRILENRFQEAQELYLFSLGTGQLATPPPWTSIPAVSFWAPFPYLPPPPLLALPPYP